MDQCGADRMKGLEQSVWVEFTGLAVQHKAVNLGQGFPDFAAPKYVTDALAAATTSTENVLLNQYTRSFGHIRLVNAIAKLYTNLLGHQIQPLTDVLITVGAYNGLFYSVFGLLNHGEEAIIIEPYYDCYEPMVRMAGGVPVFVPLRLQQPTDRLASSADMKLDLVEFEKKFSPKTKLLFLNNPNNPVGKVFSEAELLGIAEVVKRHPNVVVVSDEVYEWLVYKPNKMIRFATLPGMYERTLTIGSAGKTFSVTGWKLGWVIGPPNIMKHLQAVHQNCVYTCPTVLQEATAIGFETEMGRLDSPECFFNELPALLEPKRDRLAQFLLEVGLKPIIPQGGYFMLADYSSLKGPFDVVTPEPKDYRFVKWLCKEKKLAAIPPSAFYCQADKSLGENFVRFCFIKQDSTLAAAERIITEWKEEQHLHQ